MCGSRGSAPLYGSHNFMFECFASIGFGMGIFELRFGPLAWPGLAGRLSDSIEWVSIVFAAISLRQICITIADCNLSPNKLAAAPAPASVWTQFRLGCGPSGQLQLLGGNKTFTTELAQSESSSSSLSARPLKIQLRLLPSSVRL